MSFEFLCSECGQILRIGRHKVGATIACPRCRALTMVPQEEFAARELALIKSARGGMGVEVMDVLGYDDVPGLLNPSLYPSTIPYAPHSALGATAASPILASNPAPEPWPGSAFGYDPLGRFPRGDAPPRPGTMLLVSRWAVYAQGIVLLFVAGLSFFLGHLIGSRPLAEPQSYRDTPEKSVTLHASVTHRDSLGKDQPDSDAVLIAVPEGAQPPRLFASQGLRPHDPQNDLSIEAFRALRDLGGDATRVDQAGAAVLVVSRPGKYYVLVLSRNATRGASDKLDLTTVGQMGRYFENAAELIGRQEFRWSLEQLSATPAPLVQGFGKK